MHFDSKLVLILLAIISTTFAKLNGQCSGRSGICIKTGTCSNYGGESFSGKCPSDPNDVKCCDNIPWPTPTPTPTPGKDDTYNGPCSGGGGACINTNVVSCDTNTVSGKCQGPSNVKCCVQGSKPSWYINQGEHRKVLCLGDRSVATSGCGPSSLAMAIKVLTGNNITPETLFKEGCDGGLYHGNGFSHSTLSTLGKRHGVSVDWTSNIDSVYNALASGKGVIFNVVHDSKYHFTKEGHYIFLYGTKEQNGVKKVYVFDPNGRNNYVNVLFPLKKSDGGIEVAKGSGSAFGIVKKS